MNHYETKIEQISNGWVVMCYASSREYEQDPIYVEKYEQAVEIVKLFLEGK